VDQPSSKVDWSAGAVELLTEQREWPDNGHPRRAGVSSFGVSGTNAHVILEQAPPADPASEQQPADGPALVVARHGLYPWILSGKSPEALRDQAGRLREFVAAHPDTDAADLGWSLVTSR
jgi:acyl transferase domain-containing protein